MAPPTNLRLRSTRGPRRCLGLVGTLTAALAVSFGASAARASVITVDSTADDYDEGPNGNCTLREAVIASNTDTRVDRCSRGFGADTIEVPGGTYVLSIQGRGDNAAHAGDLDVTDAVTFQGLSRASTIIDAGQVDGGFDIRASNGTTSMFDLSVRNAAGADTAVRGGKLLLSEVDLRDAHPASPTAGGIGLAVASGSATVNDVQMLANLGSGVLVTGGSLTLSDVTINGNHSEATAGGVQVEGGTVTIRSTTIGDPEATPGACDTGNTTAAQGGGVAVLGGTVDIEQSQIAGNCAGPDPALGGGVAVLGGTLSLVRTVVTRNSAIGDALGDGGFGGGIAATAGSLSLLQSEVVANYANTTSGSPRPSGLGLMGTAQVDVDRSTLDGNHRVAIAVSAPTATLTLRNSTVSALGAEDVTAPPGAPLTSSVAISSVGGVTLTGSTLDVAELAGAPFGVLAGTGTFAVTSSVFQGPCTTNALGTPAIQSLGFNLAAEVGCGFGAPSDLDGVNPFLGPLGSYGGPTPTRPPLPLSPAIDSGDPNGCLATDQRGFTRPQDGDVDGTARCDRGAVEVVCAGTIGPDGDCIPVACGAIPGALGVGAGANLAPVAGGLVLLLGWSRRRRRARSG
ncbi:MAG: CSLREA domain-containing protein [Deltaproteobacteria bacterium]|nr:CSLREA domain-containing protein [Deltaproteobacteria bacterium]